MVVDDDAMLGEVAEFANERLDLVGFAEFTALLLEVENNACAVHVICVRVVVGQLAHGERVRLAIRANTRVIFITYRGGSESDAYPPYTQR